MALISCVGSRFYETLLHNLDEAIRDNAHQRLEALLQSQPSIPTEAINHKHLLHQAAWLGNTQCVQILLESGADPDVCHRKNGCTPLHLAHFCMIDDTNPAKTIRALIDAGADVNNPGNDKCGKVPLDHAIQRQRIGSVEVLVDCGATVNLPSLLIAIDVANPVIVELLLAAGGQCGPVLETTVYWGQALHRVLYTPLKCPRECYRQMFRLFVQATVCQPSHHLRKPASNTNIMIETELRTIARDYIDLTQYLYVFLVRNGFYPTECIKVFMKSLGCISWLDEYLGNPAPLRDLCMRVCRSHLYQSGNILFGTERLKVPRRLKDYVIMQNPM
ncbi:hypothetical protein CAPTEDRAFT_185095 [Capitella teleta]|uniref:Uncharacterized protein n=1 Tax=Capitella teleta TaxID=283909 RepID=R7U3J0_CAPTE|nr:hypothetical protein CAPTEDRAFT_185095 [Capitella teleta]|eukprot:ELT98236.1 hypothetical protein CAPTEDRAFT_185095 [Capitella teleta]